MVLSIPGAFSLSGGYLYGKYTQVERGKECPEECTPECTLCRTPDSLLRSDITGNITGTKRGMRDSKEENTEKIVKSSRMPCHSLRPRRSCRSTYRNSLKTASSLRLSAHAQSAVYDALIFFILLLLSIIVLATIVRSGVWAVEKEEKDYSLQFNQDIARVILATTIPRAEWTEGGEPVVLFQKPVDHLLLEELYVMRNVSSGGDFSTVHYQIYSMMKNLTRPSYRFCIYAHEFMTGRQFTVDDDVPLPPAHYGTRFMYDMLDKYGTAEIVVYTWQP